MKRTVLALAAALTLAGLTAAPAVAQTTVPAAPVAAQVPASYTVTVHQAQLKMALTAENLGHVCWFSSYGTDGTDCFWVNSESNDTVYTLYKCCHTDTNWSWVNQFGNWYWMVDQSNGGCLAWSADLNEFVTYSCETGKWWEEFYWSGCGQIIEIGNGDTLWYYGDGDRVGLKATEASAWWWDSGYAGCYISGG